MHYNRLKPYFPPFNKDVFGSSPVPTQNESVHTSTQNHQHDDNTDQQNENAMSDTAPQATEPAMHQQNPPPTVPTSPDPDPPLRRSTRRRQPPDRYGTVISYPDCYSSDSDT